MQSFCLISPKFWLKLQLYTTVLLVYLPGFAVNFKYKQIHDKQDFSAAGIFLFIFKTFFFSENRVSGQTTEYVNGMIAKYS